MPVRQLTKDSTIRSPTSWSFSRSLICSVTLSLSITASPLLPVHLAECQLTTTDATQVSIGVDGSEPQPEQPNYEPVVPHNGDFVVFSSKADNLTANTHDGFSSPTYNIYRRPAGTSATTTLVSANLDGRAPQKTSDGTGIPLNVGCIEPAVSEVTADGSFAVAFTSDAGDLVHPYRPPSGIYPSSPQVYLRIFRPNAAPKTLLISAAKEPLGEPPNYSQAANGRSDQPTVVRFTSPNGSSPHLYTVCFRSTAGNFLSSTGMTIAKPTIYCVQGVGLDATGNEIQLGTRLSQVAPPLIDPPSTALGHSQPTLSRDGSLLAFVSDLSLIEDAPNEFLTPPLKQVYSLSLTSGLLTLLSFNLNGQPAGGHADNPSVSHDGTFVAFAYTPWLTSVSEALKGFTGRGVPFFVRHSRGAEDYLQINTNKQGEPSNVDIGAGQIDDSGRYAVFSDRGSNMAHGAGGFAQVYFKDLEPTVDSPGGPLLPVSVSNRSPGSEHSGYGFLLGIARHVTLSSSTQGTQRVFTTAFISFATNFDSVGIPGSASPFIFRTTVNGSFGDPPPDGPASTPTPVSTHTPTPQPSPVQQTPPPTTAPIVDEVQFLVPNAPISQPPRVEAQPTNGGKRFDITIFCQLFTLDPKFGSKADFEMLAAAGARLTYSVEIRKAGSRQRLTRASSRNVVTVRKLEPGRYTIRYRVSARVGKRSIKSRTSPAATVVLS